MSTAASLQGPDRGLDVVGDLDRVDLVREADPLLPVDVEDRVPALGEEVPALLVERDHLRIVVVPVAPHVGADEAGDAGDLQGVGGAGRELGALGAEGDLLLGAGDRGPAIRGAVVRAQHQLAVEVVGDAGDLEAVAGDGVAHRTGVGGVGDGALGVEVGRVVPAGQLDRLVAEAGGELAALLEAHVLVVGAEKAELKHRLNLSR